jgi:PhnB protein
MAAKTSKVKPVPDGYHTVTPYITVKGAARAIEFYKRAFGATEIMRFGDPNGRVAHAELKIGDSIVMLADEFPEMGNKSPQSLGGTGTSIMLYVDDVDTLWKQAIGAGGKQLRPVTDQFYGDRSGFLEDPFGHQWSISTHKEDVSPEEMRKRMEEMAKQQAPA